MDRLKEPKHRFERELIVLLVLVGVKLFLHLFINAFAGYGIFRDELYYLACSHRLDAGFVDQPPLSIFILAINRLIFGSSLFALRLLPAVTGALTVLLTGLSVRKMGGRVPAILFSGLAMIAAPIFLAMNTYYSMNCIDIMLWTLAGYLVVCLVQEGKNKYWLFLGLVIGLGMLNKISMAWFALGLAAAVLLTKQRKALKTPWPYLAAVLAQGLFLPFIIWNLLHDMAHLEFIRNATQFKYNTINPLDFILGQLLLLHPLTLPVTLAGLYFYFFDKEGKTYRSLGIIFVVTFLILLVNGRSKPEYMAAAYPIVFAGGGVLLGRVAEKKSWAWLKFALPGLLVLGGLVTAPLALPCLPVQTYIDYSKALGVGVKNYEGKRQSELPQFYADMFGWEEMAAAVSRVYTTLPPEDRAETIIYAQNYGQAGAMEYFARKYELPPVVCPHNNYWIWWGREHKGKDYRVIIILGGNIDDHLSSLEEVEPVAVFTCRYCMPYENNKTIFVGRKPKRTMKEIRRSDKHFE